MGKISLAAIDTRAPRHLSKERIITETEKMRQSIIELQKKFYAWKKKSILVILQGMDTSGKDGVIRQVFSGIDPLGLRAYSWAKPTDEEYAHDFLWRLHAKTPEKGTITIFNRSYYEDIIVPSVYGYIDHHTIQSRYDHINSFEKMLEDEGTLVIKFYLHLSKNVQLQRLAERVRVESKQWKHDPEDINSRRNWDKYMKVYETLFEKTDISHAPWHIIPSDDRWYKVYLVTKTIFHILNSLHMKWPTLPAPVALLAPHKESTPSKKTDEKKAKNASAKAAKKLVKDKEKAEKKAAKAAKKLAKKKEKEAKKLAKAVQKAAEKKEKEAKKLAKKKQKTAQKPTSPSVKAPAKKPAPAAKKPGPSATKPTPKTPAKKPTVKAPPTTKKVTPATPTKSTPPVAKKPTPQAPAAVKTTAAPTAKAQAKKPAPAAKKPSPSAAKPAPKAPAKKPAPAKK